MDWIKILRTNIIILKLTGAWEFETSNGFLQKLSKLYSIFLAMFLLVLTTFLQTIELIIVSDDTKIFFILFGLIIQEFQVVIKVFSFMKNFNFLNSILHNLNSEKMFQPKTKNQEHIVDVGIKLWRKNFIVLNVGAIFAIFTWSILPLLLTNLVEKHEFVLMSWFPYNATITPNYELSLFHQIISLWIGAFVTLNIDLLVNALITFIGLQCDLLCDNLLNVGYDNNSANFNRNKVYDDFIICIKHHKKITNLATQSINFFSVIVTAQVATSAIIIGISLFQLTFTPAFTTEYYRIVLYGVTIVVQMFQYSWFANELLFKSGRIPEAAFQMNFIDAPLPMKKNLIYFIARTQRPIQIPVFKLTHLSMDTFIRILRMAWSYYALASQVSYE